MVRINKIGKHFGLKCELCELLQAENKLTNTVSETWVVGLVVSYNLVTGVQVNWQEMVKKNSLEFLGF